MRKHGFAFGVGIITAGIVMFISADSGDINFLHVASGFFFGIFIGYFIAGLIGAKSTLLQNDFQALGNVRGKSLDDIVAAVGEYKSFTTCIITDKDNEQGFYYTWAENSYSVTLLFDKDKNCIGVSSETRI